MKTVFLSVPNGLLALSFLRTDFLKILLKNNLQVVIISPLVADDGFRAEFENHPLITLHLQQPYKPGWIERTIIELAQESQIKRHMNRSLQIKQKHRALSMQNWSWWKRSLEKILLFIGQGLPTELWIDLEMILIRDHVYDALFDKYNPIGVIVGAPGTNFKRETPIIRSTQRRNIPVIAAGMSWDHFSAKYTLARKVDYLIVWNNIMRLAACERIEMLPERVEVTGVPHWDYYADKEILISREQFCERFNFNPARKLIVLSTEVTGVYNYYVEVIDILMSAIRDGSLPLSQILVRLHPYNDFDLETHFGNCADIVIEWPFRKTTLGHSFHLQVDIHKKDQMHLANTLHHADVLIGVSSTLAIEACIFDTPVINIGFDGYDDLSYYMSIARYYDYTHYHPLIETQAVALVRNPDKLIEQTQRYLRNPALHRENRKRIVRELAYKVDGKSARRAADFVMTTLEIA